MLRISLVGLLTNRLSSESRFKFFFNLSKIKWNKLGYHYFKGRNTFFSFRLGKQRIEEGRRFLKMAFRNGRILLCKFSLKISTKKEQLHCKVQFKFDDDPIWPRIPNGRYEVSASLKNMRYFRFMMGTWHLRRDLILEFFKVINVKV